MNNKFRLLGEITLLIIGMFLVVDGFFIHSIALNYQTFGLQSLDPYINHEYIGMLFVGLALLDMKASELF